MATTKMPFPRKVFWITLLTSVTLMVWGFCIPPQGVIDGSVLIATGVLLGFATLAELVPAINAGKSVKFTKGDMEISVESDDDNNN